MVGPFAPRRTDGTAARIPIGGITGNLRKLKVDVTPYAVTIWP